MTERNLNCQTRPVQRAAGQSAVVGAAYRAGERLFDERTERVADFSRRAPDVRETLILAPEGAPDWVHDRQQLWNAAEEAEKRKDGRPARDVQLGLAWELSPAQQREAVLRFAQSEFVDKGHVVDIAFHAYGQRVVDASEEGRATLRRWAEQQVPFLEASECQELNAPHVKIERNGDGMVSGYKIYQPHAHLFVTPRPIDGEGFAGKRNRELDRAETAMHWRYEWPRIQNEMLEAAGEETRVTATRRKDQGDPNLRDETVQGVARHMELRGEPTRARDAAEMASVHNEVIRLAAAEAPKDQAEVQRGTTEVDPFDAVHAQATAQAAADLSSDRQEGARQSRLERLSAWWENARASFSEWRGGMHQRIIDRLEHFRSATPDHTEPPKPTQEPAQDHEPDR